MGAKAEGASFGDHGLGTQILGWKEYISPTQEKKGGERRGDPSGGFLQAGVGWPQGPCEDLPKGIFDTKGQGDLDFVPRYKRAIHGGVFLLEFRQNTRGKKESSS